MKQVAFWLVVFFSYPVVIIFSFMAIAGWVDNYHIMIQFVVYTVFFAVHYAIFSGIGSRIFHALGISK